jgi:ethanolamine utilization cobalamin adenosyltransferase
MNEYEDVRNDILRYREVLESMLADVYALKPELAPKLHHLITLCNSVLTIVSRDVVDSESKLLLGNRVEDLKNLTEEFLQELSDAMQEKNNDGYMDQAAAA